MSNLGLYQTMTSVAKKVGGPVNFFLLVGAGGYGVIRLGEAGVRKIIKTVKNHTGRKETASHKKYVVHSSGKSNEGLVFNTGDMYRVLEIDHDSVLIEKIGDKNNPYFVSTELLKSISDFDM